MKEKNIIFTDGSSRGNPGPGGWGSIVALGDRVVELGGGEKHTTNNRMELTAVIEALEFVSKKFSRRHLGTNTAEDSPLKCVIYLDSSYVMNGATKWIYGWQKNNWKTSTKADVLNVDLWKKLATLLPGEPRRHLGTNTAEDSPRLHIEWKLVKGHSGVPANERCDEIATSFADGKKPKLFNGKLSDYAVDLKISAPKATSNKLKPKSSKAAAFSYVSMVNGVVKTHATWAECEARVKGVSATKFKKTISAQDEKDIIASWKKTH